MCPLNKGVPPWRPQVQRLYKFAPPGGFILMWLHSTVTFHCVAIERPCIEVSRDFSPITTLQVCTPPPALSLIGLTRRCNVLFVEVAPHYRGLKMSCDICVNKTSFYKPYPFLSWMLKILHCSYWGFSEIPQISLHTLPASNERE